MLASLQNKKERIISMLIGTYLFGITVYRGCEVTQKRYANIVNEEHFCCDTETVMPTTIYHFVGPMIEEGHASTLGWMMIALLVFYYSFVIGCSSLLGIAITHNQGDFGTQLGYGILVYLVVELVVIAFIVARWAWNLIQTHCTRVKKYVERAKKLRHENGETKKLAEVVIDGIHDGSIQDDK